MPTNGNATIGCLSATLAAIEVEKLIDHGPGASIAGREVYFDAAIPTHLVSGLVRNPACRFSHEILVPKPAPVGTLAQAFDATPGPRAAKHLRAFDGPFVSQLACDACDFVERTWRLRTTLDAKALACPSCRAPRSIRGFDLEDRVPAARLGAAGCALPLTALGFRPGDGFVVGAPGSADAGFVLTDSSKAAQTARGARVVVAGLGNIGSFLVPLLARIRSIDRLILCDPDRYAVGQSLNQDVMAGEVGHAKAEVQAAHARAIRTDLHIEPHATPVEDLPIGLLADSIVVSALDTRSARLRLAARAWRIGSPFVDAAVAGGSSLLLRTNVYVPGLDAPCLECAFDEAEYAALEQVHPCQAAT